MPKGGYIPEFAKLEAMQLMAERDRNGLSVTAIAQRCKISPRHVWRLWRAEKPRPSAGPDSDS